MQDNKYIGELFNLLNQIDDAVGKVGIRGVVMVGMTRAGKSTGFNWMNHTPIKAVLDGDLMPCYEPIDKKSATVSHSVTSCTLVPNISLMQGFDLIDAAGYEDRRNYIGAVGVAYSLKALTEKVNEIKFIVVVQENAIYRNKIELFSTLNKFIGMFKFQQITPEMKSSIFDSTSMLVTKCEKPNNLINPLTNCLKQLRNEQLFLANRGLIQQLLQHLLEKEKISFFKMAEIDVQPEQSKFLQTIETKEWKFFAIKAALTTNKKAIVQLPFEQLYNKLDETQKKMIETSLKKRIQSYSKFCGVLSEVVKQTIKIENINKTDFQKSLFIQLITSFITENDHYQAENRIDKSRVKKFLSAPTHLRAFHLLIQLQKVITKPFPDPEGTDQASKFMVTMAVAKQKFLELSRLFQLIYADSVNSSTLLLKLQHILMRGIREFEMLYEISPYYVSDAAERIKDAFNGISISEIIIIQNYIKSFKITDKAECFSLQDQDSLAMQGYLPTQQKAQEFYLNFSKEQARCSKDTIEYFPLMRDVKLIISKYFFKANNYKQSAKSLLEALRIQCKYQLKLAQQIKSNPQTDANGVSTEQQLTLNILNKQFPLRKMILNGLKENLLKLNSFELAKQIATLNRDLFFVSQIYKHELDESKTMIEKRKILLSNFADFCFKFGDFKECVNSLKELFSLESQSYEKQMLVNKRLIDVVTSGQAKSNALLLQYLNTFKPLEYNDPSLIELISKLSTQIK